MRHSQTQGCAEIVLLPAQCTQLKSDCRLWTELVVEKVEHISFTIHVLNIVRHVAKEWERRKFCPRHCYDAGLLIPL